MKSDLKGLHVEIEFFGELVCVKWHGVLEGHWKIDKLEWSSPYAKSREDI